MGAMKRTTGQKALSKTSTSADRVRGQPTSPLPAAPLLHQSPHPLEPAAGAAAGSVAIAVAISLPLLLPKKKPAFT